MSSMDKRKEKSAHITTGQVAPHRLPNLTTERLTDCMQVCHVGMKTSALNQPYRTLEFNHRVIMNDDKKRGNISQPNLHTTLPKLPNDLLG
jgi:hypothetical protein